MKVYPSGFTSSCVHLPRSNITLHVLDNGKLDASETLVFSHGLLFSTFMWTDQMKFFDSKGYRVIAFDHRGQGLSESPATLDSISVDTVGNDAQELLEVLIETKGVKNIHFAGMSMGGFTGMRVAAQTPELLKTLILVNTDAEPDKSGGTVQNKILCFIMHYFGIREFISDSVLPIFFYGQDYRVQNRQKWIDYWSWNLKNYVYRAVDGVFNRPAFTRLNDIKTPTIIIHGRQDISLAYDHAIKLSEQIAGPKLVPIENSGHQSPQEQPENVNEAILNWLEEK
eukprot:TRINITY_DN10024_c0_g1_i1.p1 TRINITY_DN10024_c0_g1~~TRINITY_DN10024_c0_g1_i1.p1  ORF type:complete len:331 (+),score=69.74 TRINITY_DN10024_c0_g1_i1:145-993(+)